MLEELEQARSTARAALRDRTFETECGTLRGALATSTGGEHVGRQNAVDVMQADTVRGLATVVEHETFHHNVPAFLERAGVLVALIRRELLEILVGA